MQNSYVTMEQIEKAALELAGKHKHVEAQTLVREKLVPVLARISQDLTARGQVNGYMRSAADWTGWDGKLPHQKHGAKACTH